MFIYIYNRTNHVLISTPSDDIFLDTDECTGDPCINGATCVDAVNSYSCDCVAGYTGEYCEIGRCYIRDKVLHCLYLKYTLQKCLKSRTSDRKPDATKEGRIEFASE